MSIRIILADDHKIISDGLRSLIEKEKDMEVIAQATNGIETITTVRKEKPNVVIMDIGMPGMNGIEATRQLKNDMPDLKIIGLSMHSDKKFITEMLKAAAGYLLKDCASEELITAIRTVTGNKTYLSPSIAETIVADYVRGKGEEAPSVFSVLSGREREVLQLLAEGKTTRQIAKMLHISPKTVESHRAQVMNKLQIDNIAELTKYAIREGLTQLDK